MTNPAVTPPKDAVLDLFVIGGGINGTGIAADAAGRGLRVALAEKSDLASATSSASSKLVHGGLRYLEYYEFRLVREALAEREVLLAKAPHLIWPLRFVLPHVPGVRPRWMVRAGLALYDNLYRRRHIPRSRAINLAADPAGKPLKAEYPNGFTYWDCWVDDARLVVLNAKAARDRGAEILTRTRVVGLSSIDGLWRIMLDNSGEQREVRARALVNAAGPWVDKIDGLALGNRTEHNQAHLRLIKGSHIVVRRIPGADDAYLMQGTDKRVVFVLPFEERFTIIGTTDITYAGDPADVSASVDEEHYLLELANRFFQAQLSAADIVWRYAGVRPLYDDASDNPSAVTRDYHLELKTGGDQPPRLSVYGGKVTTYRRLAEEALAKLQPHIGRQCGPAWTASAPLPGGDIAADGFEAFTADLLRRYPAFEPKHLKRLARRHGSLVSTVMGDAKTPTDMGQNLFGGLTAREIAYMKSDEWATTPQDVLWRRTKLGLHALQDLTLVERDTLEASISRLL